MSDPTPGLFQQHLELTNIHPHYRKGYVDALLDVYNLITFANEIEPVSFKEPQYDQG